MIIVQGFNTFNGDPEQYKKKQKNQIKNGKLYEKSVKF